MDYRERFDSWRQSCCHSCLGGYESQNENWYGNENEEEKVDEKINIIGKTRWHLTYSTAIGSLRLDQRHGRNRKNYKR